MLRLSVVVAARIWIFRALLICFGTESFLPHIQEDWCSYFGSVCSFFGEHFDADVIN